MGRRSGLALVRPETMASPSDGDGGGRSLHPMSLGVVE
jgi:hypothetical protein